MAYISLYRKYRSQTFEDVMGQDHVTRTLQNAIRQGKVAHAYLFCGTRGTGKTTTARLLAKALNCVKEKNPTPLPCNECSACKSITDGSAMDIVELDAASHRGIGDIKDINENVKYPPMELRYKVFIIDEAHQLSNDAKDAFLKTLEEPPAHAVFVLATTEPQSIPITIRSRCQQFDFRRGSLRDLRERIKFVTESEGLQADDAALDLMATSADGSWRDALSLLEQVLAYTDGTITADDVNAVLGTVAQDFLFKLADVIAAGDDREAFEVAAEAVGSGKEIQTLMRSVAQHFRNLMFALVAKNLGDMATSEENLAKMRAQAAKFSKQSLFRIVEIFTQAERDTRFSDQHRLLLELALLKAIEVSHSKAEPAPAPVSRPAPQQVSAPASRVEKPAEPVRPVEKPREPVKKIEATPQVKTEPTPTGHPVQQHLPEFDKIKEKWNAVLQHLRSISVPAHALLVEATPIAVRDGALVLQFKHQGHADIIRKTGNNPKRQALLAALQRVFGVANAEVVCEIGAPTEAPTKRAEVVEEAPSDMGHEILSSVLDIFDGEIV